MPVTSWSYSALAQYELCPAQYKFTRLDKLPVAPKAYFDKGNRIHANVERYVNTRGAVPIDVDVKKELAFVGELARSTAHKAVEQKWGFSRDWSPAPWSTAHFRMIVDVLVDYGDGAAEVIDWKSGRKYGSNKDQMDLFATGTFHRLRSVDEVTTRLVYLEAGGQELADYERHQLPEMTAAWEARAARLFSETEWRPRPNDKCGFCDFSRSKGGPCRHG